MKKVSKLFLTCFIFLTSLCAIAQNLSGTWDSSSGSSFKVISTSGGMKYYNLAGGNWINSTYIGNNQYQAYFYNSSTLVNIITFTQWNNNSIQATHYNGKSSYWTRRGSYDAIVAGSRSYISPKSKAIQIEQYEFEIRNLKSKIRESERQLASYQSRNNSYGATSFSTEQSYRNLIDTYNSQIWKYEKEISHLRGY